MKIENFRGSERARHFSRLAAVLTILILITASRAVATPPLPADKRIPAQVTSYLAPPATQPMRMPNALTVDSSGNVLVADGAQDRIVRFRADGSFDSAFTQIDGRQLNSPTGMKFDGQGRLWLADTGNHRILIISPQGKVVEEVRPPPAPDAKPCNPTDIALTADGKRCYVVDMKNQRVLIRDNVSKQWSPMGSGGRALGQFQWPFMACIGDQGYFFVTEVIGARVQLLSPDDKWAGVIGSWGVELGQFYRPKGIAADITGRLFVSDSTTGVVQVFGPRGAALGALTDPAGNLLRFQHPMGLCFDAAGKLYVVELSANRVAVVTLGRDARAKP